MSSRYGAIASPPRTRPPLLASPVEGFDADEVGSQWHSGRQDAFSRTERPRRRHGASAPQSIRVEEEESRLDGSLGDGSDGRPSAARRDCGGGPLLGQRLVAPLVAGPLDERPLITGPLDHVALAVDLWRRQPKRPDHHDRVTASKTSNLRVERGEIGGV